MNSLQNNINNLLVVIDSNNYLTDLYKICLNKVQKGFLVLIITSKKFDFSPLSQLKKLKKEHMKRLIVINYTTIKDVSKKLMDLHDWSLLPALVVVDVSGLISTELSSVSSAPIMKSISLCAASFLDYLHSVSMQKESQPSTGGDAVPSVHGLFIVKTEGDQFGAQHLQLLQNLYFYRTELLDSLEKLPNLLESGNSQ